MNEAAATAEIRELELSLNRSEVRSSRVRVSTLLSDDFMEFGSSGRVYDKAAILELLAAEQDAEPPPHVDDFAVRFLTREIALATYRSVRPERTTLRTSIWRLEAGRWRMAFHQGTPVPQ